MDTRSVSLGLSAALLLALLIALRASAVDDTQRIRARHHAVSQHHREVRVVTAAGIAEQVAGTQSLGLVVTATVGINPNVCAQAEFIRVPPDTRVYYCYQATNTGDEILITHTITDSRAGVIWDRQTFELVPGETLNTVTEGISLDSVVTQDDRMQVAWTASAITPTMVTSATARAWVSVLDAGITVTKTTGVSGSNCAPKSEAVVPEGGDAGFCVVVENIGNLPLVQHRLTDPLLEIDASFTYTLSPSELLTITHGGLPGLGIDGSLVRREVTRSFANTVYYTATSASDATATGAASASDVASSTVSLAQAGIRFTATVGTDPALCGTDTNLTISNPNTDLYLCATLHNEGNVPITHHALAQPARDLVSDFDHILEPGAILSVTNALLDQLRQPRTLGPVSVYDGDNLSLSNAMIYTGTTSLALGREDERRSYTITASSSTYASIASTPNPTPTATFTPRSATARPTNTPLAVTPTWTPASPLATPTVVAQQGPTDTPTPTRSYQISLLQTPTPTGQAVSPLPLPAVQADTVATAAAVATHEAESTLAALYATATAAADSPLVTPSPTTVIPPTTTATPQPTETAAPTPTRPTTEAMVIVVTSTSPPPTQRPIQPPPPVPTPDYLLFAARTVDSFVMTATWIWFLIGSLAFFVVAGVLVGLSFSQNERQRFDLVDAGLVEEYEFLLPPPEPPQSDDAEAWPE